jgi:hypothetical protein
MWMMGLLSMSWITNDLKLKTEQGYCWTRIEAWALVIVMVIQLYCVK